MAAFLNIATHVSQEVQGVKVNPILFWGICSITHMCQHYVQSEPSSVGSNLRWAQDISPVTDTCPKLQTKEMRNAAQPTKWQVCQTFCPQGLSVFFMLYLSTYLPPVSNRKQKRKLSRRKLLEGPEQLGCLATRYQATVSRPDLCSPRPPQYCRHKLFCCQTLRRALLYEGCSSSRRYPFSPQNPAIKTKAAILQRVR